eukprot:3817311-Rhodomonas_salina.2
MQTSHSACLPCTVPPYARSVPDTASVLDTAQHHRLGQYRKAHSASVGRYHYTDPRTVAAYTSSVPDIA